MLTSERECRETARLLESRMNEDRQADDQRMTRTRQFYRELGEQLQAGVIPLERIRLRHLFEAFVGREALQRIEPGYRADGTTLLMEAGDFVSTTAFSNIIGQVTYASVMETLQAEQFIGMDLHSTVPATTQQVEQIPGVTMIGDVAEDIGEGQEYPRVGIGEERIKIPEKVKDGFILELSEEAIWEDKTGLVTQRANTGTTSMAQTMEKELLDNALGITTSYSRNGGPEQATYANTHTQGDFDNLVASNALVDWTDIEAVIKVLSEITDPNTGEPVFISAPDLVVPLALHATALRVVSATEIRVGDGSSGGTQTISSNPVPGIVGGRGQVANVRTNAYVKNRTSSDSTWFIGDFKKAFGYSEVWPVSVHRMEGQNSMLGHNRDIVSSIKVRRKGVPFVRDPRYVAKCTA